MEDKENRIFEPDVVLSAEFFGERTGVPSPERALMIAVLEEASRCLLRPLPATPHPKQQALYDEAREWFASSERAQLYDFENVCAVLGIDPGWLRERLFRLVDERRVAAASAAPHRLDPIADDEEERQSA